ETGKGGRVSPVLCSLLPFPASFARRHSLAGRAVARCRWRPAMATAEDLAASYYSGRPLSYDEQQQQARAVPTPVPAPQQPPPQGAGEQANNHTQVHGVPGYYSTRLKNTNTVAPAPPPAVTAPPPAVADNQKELSFIDKILMCFKSGKNEK
ncbi:unnamed protein product, partial [Urochloa humidicola]